MTTSTVHSLAGMDNPFRSSIVKDPWQAPEVDVAEIHAEVFSDCCAALEQVARRGDSTSLLIHGAAGSGKTHLLARLRRHLAQRQRAGEPGPIFAWVKLQTNPRMIWRHTRRCLVDDLMRPLDGGTCQLQRLLLARLAELRPADGELELWWHWIRQDAPQELEQLVTQLADECALDSSVLTVVRHFALRRHMREVRSWLRGESLPEPVLQRLELPTAGEYDEDLEQQARDLVLALCRLAGPRMPVVFCFDQIEALQANPQDATALYAFGQLVSALHDETQNTLVICCVQSSFADKLREEARGADYDRMREYGSRSLLPVQWPLAARLVAARLDSQPALAELRRGQPEPLWPLKEQDLRTFVGPQGCTPRRLLSACADLFASKQQGQLRGRLDQPAPPVSDDDFLNAEFQRLYADPSAVPTEQSQAVLAHGLPLLVPLTRPEWRPADVPTRHHRDIDLSFQSTLGRINISLCMNRNMSSLAARLKRLRRAADELGPSERLVLIRDARMPISRRAKRTREHLQALADSGAAIIYASTEALAALDALRRLLSESKAGDLSHRGQTLQPSTVQEWLAANLPDCLHELAERLVGGAETSTSSEEAAILEDLADLLAEEHVLPLDDCAARLGRPAAAILHTVQEHTEHFGHLSGPPAVLFQRVADT